MIAALLFGLNVVSAQDEEVNVSSTEEQTTVSEEPKTEGATEVSQEISQISSLDDEKPAEETKG